MYSFMKYQHYTQYHRITVCVDLSKIVQGNDIKESNDKNCQMVATLCTN